MFRVKHFSTKRSITKHRKHIFFDRNAFLRSCMTGCLWHFSAQNVKFYLWKRWDDHHKIPFSNNRKTKLKIQPLSYCRFFQQTYSHTTRISQNKRTKPPLITAIASRLRQKEHLPMAKSRWINCFASHFVRK